MFNWKVVTAIFITLGLLVVFLASSPSVGGFFDVVKDKMSQLTEQKVERNVSFSLSTSMLSIAGNAKDAEIEMDADSFVAQLKDVNVSSSGRIRILGFSGSVSVEGRIVSLDGTFKKAELEKTELRFPQGNIKSHSSFSRLAVDSLALKEFVAPEGRLIVNNVETRSDSEIRISDPQGRWEFDSAMKVEGNASRIEVPGAKISIG